MTDLAQQHRGRFGAGMAQALAIWLAAMVLAGTVRVLAVAWSAAGAALLACILLGQWHNRRSRPDTAVGSFTGAALWPLLIAATITTIGILAESHSP